MAEESHNAVDGGMLMPTTGSMGKVLCLKVVLLDGGGGDAVAAIF